MFTAAYKHYFKPGLMWYIDYAAKYSPEILRTLRVRALNQAS